MLELKVELEAVVY